MSNMTDRYCVACFVSIYECMGFVKVGDLIDKNGNILPPHQIGQVRELCGKCVNNHKWTANNNLVKCDPVW